MLPQNAETIINDTFNRRRPSLSTGSVAYADRPGLRQQVFDSLRDKGGTPLVLGHMGVGKTSLIRENVSLLLGPQKIHATFRRHVSIQGSSLRGDFAGSIAKQVHEALNDHSVKDIVQISDNGLADLLSRNYLLLWIDNLQGAMESQQDIEQLLSFIKHLGDNFDHFPNAKVVLTAGLPYQRRGELLSAGRLPIDLIDVPPWEGLELEGILVDGSKKCGLKFHPAVKQEIVNLSCGIPATVHILAREAALEMVAAGRRARDEVNAQDLEAVITPTRIRKITDNLNPGTNYLEILQGYSELQLAVAAFAARHMTPFDGDKAVSLISSNGDWHPQEVREALHNLAAKKQPFVDQSPYGDAFYCRDLLGGSAALLHLRVQLATSRTKRKRLSWLYDTLTHTKPDDTVPLGKDDHSVVKILFLSADPSDQARLRLGEEIWEIDHALRLAEYRDRFKFEQHHAVRTQDVQEYLMRHKPDIVHFSGHGTSAGQLIFEDDAAGSRPVSARALGNLFKLLHDNIKVVVLNACYTEVQAAAIAEHIGCVVGMSGAISDDAAKKFSPAFYSALGFCRSVKTAFELACNAIDWEGLGEQDKPKLLAPHCDPDRMILINCQ
jgi:hypothetical protein